MLFANKKEEVLDIQLTPHGRYLLSLGRLKPAYYSFHDPNILYDGRYASVTEYTKAIEDRIQHETPQMKTLASRANRDNNAGRIYEPMFDLASDTQPTTYQMAAIEQMSEQKFYLATHMLGTTAISSENAPKWSVKVLNGEISGSVPHLTASHQTLTIPQIDIDIMYKTAVFNTASIIATELPIKPDPVLNTGVFEDGTYVVVQPEHVLLEVLEENSNYNKINFEIEVFEVLEEQMSAAKSGLGGSSNIKQRLKPLLFEKKTNLIQNNILFDLDELPQQELIDQNDPRIAKYYFDVLVDNEIDPTDICEAISTLESKSLFVDLDVACLPGITPTRYDIYSGPLTTPCPPPDVGPAGDDDDCSD